MLFKASMLSSVHKVDINRERVCAPTLDQNLFSKQIFYARPKILKLFHFFFCPDLDIDTIVRGLFESAWRPMQSDWLDLKCNNYAIDSKEEVSGETPIWERNKMAALSMVER